MRAASGRFAAKLMRQRFGIAAPRVEIQTQIPWYWRWVGIAVLLGVAAAAAALDLRRRPALRRLRPQRGAGRSCRRVRGELASAQRRARAAARDRQRRRQPRRRSSAPRSRSSRSRSATLEQENARVREELATFESMLSSEARNAQTAVDLPLQGGARRAAGRVPLPAAAAHPERPPRARFQRPPGAGGQPDGRGRRVL